MSTDKTKPYAIVQVAYYVADIRQAAKQMTQTFGAGPFFVIDQIELAWGVHRGQPCPFVHSSAYGQWGEIMMELVQQDSDGASPFRDLYAPGEQGLHHVATMVDSMEQAYTHYAAQGIHVATKAATLTGNRIFLLGRNQTNGTFCRGVRKIDAAVAVLQYGATSSAGLARRDSAENTLNSPAIGNHHSGLTHDSHDRQLRLLHL